MGCIRCWRATSRLSTESPARPSAPTTTAEHASCADVSREHWEKQANNWAAWARTEFDAYWKYSPAFFELVPPPQGRTLEVGCGEGRVTRDLARLGHSVVAIDPV